MPSMSVMAESEGIMHGWDWAPRGRVVMMEEASASSLRDVFRARARRDYVASDAIRDELARAGVSVESERDRVRGKW